MRRLPLFLLVAFILVPIAEIYVLIQVGQVIGAWWTVLLLIADSIFGSWLLKREGAKAWTAFRIALGEGRMPAKELADGILVVVGGTLMISPGFITDVFGILLILPLTRPIGRQLLARVLARRLVFVTGTGGPGFRPGAGSGNAHRPGPDVVQGDVVDPTDP
ncbi:MAG: FxsA family protein [Marmoricola sp.]